MTDRELLDALARDVANVVSALGNTVAAAAIRARHAAPEAVEAGKRWYGVDRKGFVSDPRETEAEVKQEFLVVWDRDFPDDAPHLAILATDADDARRQYRERVGATVNGISVVPDATMPPNVVVMRTETQAASAELPTPAPSDDAAEALLWILDGNGVMGISRARALDLARTVVAERDQARRELDEARHESVEAEATAAYLAAESVLSRHGFTRSADGATWRPPVNEWATKAHEAIARADAAERTVAELRALLEGKANA